MKRQLLCSKQQQQQLVNTEHTTLSFLFMVSFQPMKADNTQKGKAVKLFVFFFSLIATTAATVGILISFFVMLHQFIVTVFASMLNFNSRIIQGNTDTHTYTHIRINFELKIRNAQI